MNRFGLGFFLRQPKIGEVAKIVEESGFDNLWVLDESPFPPYTDVFVNMCEAVRVTKTMKVGSALCNPYTRHPALIAVGMASLNELAPGRIITCIGAGGTMTLGPLGIKMWEKPLSTIREAFRILRGMYAGETVTFEGEVLKAVNCRLKSKINEKMPIYLGARGPKMLGLAGELSDGVLMTFPLDSIDHALDKIKEGAKKANRKREEIEIVNEVIISVSKKREDAIENAKATLCILIASLPDKDIAHKKGINLDEVNAVRNALKKGVPEATKKMTSNMVELFAIVGTPDECAEKIEKWTKSGIDQLSLSIIGEDLNEKIETTGEIIKSFKE